MKPAITSLKASVIAQLASYMILFLIYAHISDISLITSVKKVTPKYFSENGAYYIYYISSDKHTIRKMNLAGEKSLDVATYPDKYFDSLYLQRSNNVNKWSLTGRYANTQGSYKYRDISLLNNVLTKTYTQSEEEVHSPYKAPSSFMNYGDGICLNKCEMTAETGFWSNKGLNMFSSDGDRVSHLALETPFLSWYSRNATVLSKERIVYQLNDQIVLYDNKRKVIGLLSRGFSPVVVDESK